MLQIKMNYFNIIIIVVSIWYQSKLIIKCKIVKVLEFEQKKGRHFLSSSVAHYALKNSTINSGSAPTDFYRNTEKFCFKQR